ncbi:type IV pili methyl-accepting chemotaxis transducer N-terminal domain-containing protein [Yoonia sp.]|uniref:type IV pili methyl-accepting chemotaxis transducer N-terminal domain-containing protein n=1 Tax=Yoonia sp. TaxID=2212373 RepID=UPI0023B714A3
MIRFVGALWVEVFTYARMICAATVVAFGLPAFAQSSASFENGTITLALARYAEDADTSQRIDLSGKLRMLSQRVVAEACFVQAGIATQDTIPALKATIFQVSAILHALEFGNTSMGVFGAEDRRKTLAGIAQFNGLWASMQSKALTIAQGDGTADDVAKLNAQGTELLRAAYMLVTTITTQYANPAEMRQADAMVIDLARRQQLLTQTMSRDVCLTVAGIETEDALDTLTTARAAFNSSLGALSAGMPSLGIQAPPTSKIDASLSNLRAIWFDMRQPIDAQLSGASLNQAQLSAVFYGASDLTRRMNSVVALYAAASRFQS